MIIAISFQNSWAWGLLILPFGMLVYYFIWNKHSNINMQVSTLGETPPVSLKISLKKLMPFFNILATLLIIIGIARPQDTNKQERSKVQGIDIILALDGSSSMLDQDFSPNRLEAAKFVASKFVSKRINDRIGIVVFAGESYTLCPPTIDHNVVQKQLASIENGMIQDGTAIGMGLSTSVRALKNSNAKTRVCILLTDGVNTAGTIAPIEAINIAKMYAVKVYCIGIGSNTKDISGIDEPLMQKISKETGGIYFKASSIDKLELVYDEIDRLERVDIDKNLKLRYKDIYFPFAWAALIILVVSFILQHTWLRGIN